MAITTLYPTAWGVGQQSDITSDATYSPPVVVGGGSTADDSDGTYFELGAWRADSTNYAEAAYSLFTAPASLNPTALLLQIRARTTPESLGRPTGSDNRSVGTGYFTAAGDYLYDFIDPSAVAPLRTFSVAEPEWFTYFYTNDADLENPSDEGGWADIVYLPGLFDALTGDGLRVAHYFYTAEEAAGRVPSMDLMEVRLLVATDAATFRPAPPCRLYPRDDRLGNSPRLYPPPKTRQAGNRLNGYL